jgi:hypothetical protein
MIRDYVIVFMMICCEFKPQGIETQGARSATACGLDEPGPFFRDLYLLLTPFWWVLGGMGAKKRPR